MSRAASMGSRSGSPGAGFWLCLLLVAVYLLSYSGAFHSIDEVSVAAMTESLVKHGRLTTDQIWWSQDWTPSQGRVGPDGHVYSKKGMGAALLGAPFYWLALRLPAMGAVQALMLANAFVTALTGWLLYRCVLQLGYRPAVAILTALGFGLGTMAWPYARYFFTEPLTGLALMIALWGLLTARQTGQARYAAIAGAGLGLTLLTKVASGVTWPLFLAYGFWIAFSRWQAGEGKRRQAIGQTVALLLPLFLAGLGLLAYNAVRTGHPLHMGYTPAETFSTPLGRGLAGFLVSPGKSLFLFSPLLLAALLGIPALLRRDRATALLSLGVVTVYTLVHASWFMWWGGWSWGPRFLVPVPPLLSLFLAPVVAWVLQPSRLWGKVSLAILALLSVGVQLLGVMVDFNRYLLLLYQRGIDSADVNFRVDLSPMLGHWDLLRARVWDLAWARDLAAGVDWPRLLWPLVALVCVLAGWYLARQTEARRTEPRPPGARPPGAHLPEARPPGARQAEARRAIRAGGWALAAASIGLLAVSAVTAARLPVPADDWEAGCQALSAKLQAEARPGEAMVVDLLPYADHLGHAVALMNRYKAQPAYWGWARQEPVSAERQALLADLTQEYERFWLALDTTPEGDPASTTERWLDEHAYRLESQWLSPAVRLVTYRSPAGSLDESFRVPLELRLGDRLWLQGYSPAMPFGARAGDTLAFSLFWQAEQPVEEDYVVFVQLLDQAGGLQAQADRMPVGGFRPTHTWQRGEVIRDNYGLALSPDLPPGQYRLIVGLYLPSSMERLPVSDADGVQLGDHVPLTEVMIGQEQP